MNKYLAYFLVMAFCIGCAKSPKAGLNMPSLAEVNRVLNFYNNSEDAESYLWKFGDGEVSTDPFPQKAYKDTGTYTITLIAYSKNGKESSTAMQTIRIGMRHLKKVVVKRFPPKKPNGDSWDGVFYKPDILFTCSKNTSPIWDFMTPYISDADEEDLPISWEMDIALTNEKWDFGILDYDLEFPDIDYDIMYASTWNPIEYTTRPIIYESSDWLLEFHWEVE